jgi:hypothetical protein
MKATRKRRAPRKTAKATPSLARLPTLAGPVMRGATADPWRTRMAGSNDDCVACVQACGMLGGHLRSICESLCLTACTA